MSRIELSTKAAISQGMYDILTPSLPSLTTHRSEEIIGHEASYKSLAAWLQRWNEVHLTKTKKVPFSKENPGAKAVLLSGPPGIGKTTMATLAASALGYETLELNASDARSKKAIVEQVRGCMLPLYSYC